MNVTRVAKKWYANKYGTNDDRGIKTMDKNSEFTVRQWQKHADISYNVNEYDVSVCVCVYAQVLCVDKKIWCAVPRYILKNNLR